MSTTFEIAGGVVAAFLLFGVVDGAMYLLERGKAKTTWGYARRAHYAHVAIQALMAFCALLAFFADDETPIAVVLGCAFVALVFAHVRCQSRKLQHARNVIGGIVLLVATGLIEMRKNEREKTE